MQTAAAAKMRDEALRAAQEAKGFLSPSEGERLFELSASAQGTLPMVEIGGYCGKSAVYLGDGCRWRGKGRVLSIDHHRGSAEQQPGESYFDAELFDVGAQAVDTLPAFRLTIRRAGLEDWVIPVVGESAAVRQCLGDIRTAAVFIDGSHGALDVVADFGQWGPTIVPGGYLCFHDVYPNPKDGGQAPFGVFEHARALSEWDFVGLYGSLGVLQRR